MRHLWLIVSLEASACVVGQGQGDDGLGVEPSSLQAGTPGAAGGGGASGAAEVRAADASGANSDSGARDGNTSDGDNDGGRTADHDAAIAKDSSAANDTDAQCAPDEVDVCNPVTNEGCPNELMMQCAVDPLSTLTGYCIFYSEQPPMLGGDCFNSGVTESCAPTSTCVDGRCRELCFCDTDCDSGECCAEPLESTGFKLCGEC